MASITVAADQHGAAATGAQVASSGKVHWRSGPMDSGHKRALREILCRQRRPHQGASGRDSGSDLAVGTGVAPAFPPAGQLSTPSATILPHFACQTTIAAQSIRRKPCGQHIVKQAYSCLTIKNQNHYRLASLRSQLPDARFLRKSDTVNTSTHHRTIPPANPCAGTKEIHTRHRR